MFARSPGFPIKFTYLRCINFNMKSQESALLAKEKFLNENETITETPILPTDSCDIGSDDEVWMLQCPKSIEIDALINRKLKLPGRTRHEHIETVANKCLKATIITLATRSKHGDKLQKVPIQGHIVVRERAKNHEIEEVNPNDENMFEEPAEIKFPEHFKTRHPIFGADFEDILELTPVIQARLKEAGTVDKKHKKRRIKVERESKDITHSVKAEVGEDDREVRVKKEKKRKRQPDESFEGDNEHKAKKIKSESVDNQHDDLDWIKQL